jgi:acetyltransferase-like isoleucine patch superfamily enzyme
VLLARNVYIADHMHAFEDHLRPILDQGIDRVSPVVIEAGAWLAQNVVIGPGVTVGRGAVVGANSVVLCDVPDYTVAVGAPARIVRRFARALEIAR